MIEDEKATRFFVSGGFAGKLAGVICSGLDAIFALTRVLSSSVWPVIHADSTLSVQCPEIVPLEDLDPEAVRSNLQKYTQVRCPGARNWLFSCRGGGVGCEPCR